MPKHATFHTGYAGPQSRQHLVQYGVYGGKPAMAIAVSTYAITITKAQAMEFFGLVDPQDVPKPEPTPVVHKNNYTVLTKTSTGVLASFILSGTDFNDVTAKAKQQTPVNDIILSITYRDPRLDR